LRGASCHNQRFRPEVHKGLLAFDSLKLLTLGLCKRELSLLDSGHDVSVCHQLDAHSPVPWVENLAAVCQVSAVQHKVADVVEKVADEREWDNLRPELLHDADYTRVDKFTEAGQWLNRNLLVTVDIFIAFVRVLARLHFLLNLYSCTFDTNFELANFLVFV